ncbi:hypothetical protein VTH06DRAFT_6806 [Thermothelomyces fergusii]
MASFTTLPPELLQIVGHHVSEFGHDHAVASLAALARTCRLHHWVFNDQLYEIDAMRSSGSLAMLWGAAVGGIRTMELALAHGANVNWRGYVGHLPDPRELPGPYPVITARHVRASTKDKIHPQAAALHLALKMGHDEAVEWLLAHGASVKLWCRFVCDCYGHRYRALRFETWPVEYCYNPKWYPLHLAICFGRLSAVRLLVEAGAPLDMLVHSARSITTGRIARPTALQNAAFAGNWEIFEYLLDRPVAKSRSKSSGGEDITLYDPLFHGFGIGPREHRVYIMQRLVSHGQRLGDDATTPSSVLYRACVHGIYAAALDLLDTGACPQLSRVSLQVLLFLTSRAPATTTGRINDVPRDRYYEGKPDLRQRDRLELVGRLLRLGADPNGIWMFTDAPTVLIADTGITPLMNAAVSTQPAEILPANAALEVVKLMCAWGGDLAKVTPNEGMNTLHFVVKKSISGAQGEPSGNGWLWSEPREFSPWVVGYLLQEGNLSADTKDSKGKTVFDYIHNSLALMEERVEHVVGQLQTAAWPRPPEPVRLRGWRILGLKLAETILSNAKLPLPQEFFDLEMDRIQILRRRIHEVPDI